jgi:hypothetical protein
VTAGRWALAVAAGLALSCAPAKPVPALPRLERGQVAKLIPSDVKDRGGWAQDILAAFDANGLWPDAPSVCSALAIIEQESGYEPNPPVQGLAAIVERELEERAEKSAGILAKPILDEVLSGKAPETTESFRARLR